MINSGSFSFRLGSAYLRAASIPIRAPRQIGPPSKPATADGVSTDPERSKPASSEVVSTDSITAATSWPPPGRAPAASACEPYREIIERAVGLGRNAMAIYQDLVSEHGLHAKYASVRRFVARRRAQELPEAQVVIHTEAGQEGDYGEGPMVRQPETGKYRRTRLFVFTLGHSRKSIRLISFKSSSRIWAELHERAFRRLGGAPRVVVLDNLREGVIKPDFYDPTLNPSFVMIHRGPDEAAPGVPFDLAHELPGQFGQQSTRAPAVTRRETPISIHRFAAVGRYAPSRVRR